jgi:DNA-binding MarR family transcriptional regulator
VNALELYQVGRWLSRVAEDAMRPPGAPVTPPGARLILMDISAHADCSIGEIASRTGLPQGYVSGTVARMREQGVFETRPDPADRRRTLVRLTDDIPRSVMRAGAVRVDDALLKALAGSGGTDEGLIRALERLAACLRDLREQEGAPAPRAGGIA